MGIGLQEWGFSCGCRWDGDLGSPVQVDVVLASEIELSGSFRFSFSRELPENFLGYFYIAERELAGFDEVGHYGLRTSAKQG